LEVKGWAIPIPAYSRRAATLRPREARLAGAAARVAGGTPQPLAPPESPSQQRPRLRACGNLRGVNLRTGLRVERKMKREGESKGEKSQSVFPRLKGGDARRVRDMGAAERGGGNIKGCEHFYPRVKALDCLVCAIFAAQRPCPRTVTRWTAAVQVRQRAARVSSKPAHIYLTEFVNYLVSESQLPHKIVNLLCTITNQDMRLMILW